MGNKPWEEKVTEDNSDKLTRQSVSNDMVSTPILTILLSLFFLIIIGILFFVLYASNGGGNEKKASSTFYGSSKTTQTEASNQETQAVSDSTEATTDATTTSSGDTIEVQSGEGAAAIAARAGISVEKLYELNPDHMTQGYWYANPGDQVKIN
ncbi:SAG1386/EF1546 family surface-associated protein [Streptococcus ferus]|uniref:SAG1386/EF1546 family surface-associated protein n=1 Tax=Streptococcus ferus TaxID=1345 RepID=UPI00235266B7|nr:SAG1386/EF1546 family surface-associated protein [Streptococcus ferus]